MKLWRRRKPVDLVKSQLEAAEQWDGPDEVIHDLAMAKIIDSMNRNLERSGKIPLRDKIMMATIRR